MEKPRVTLCASLARLLMGVNYAKHAMSDAWDGFTCMQLQFAYFAPNTFAFHNEGFMQNNCLVNSCWSHNYINNITNHKYNHR